MMTLALLKNEGAPGTCWKERHGRSLWSRFRREGAEIPTEFHLQGVLA